MARKFERFSDSPLLDWMARHGVPLTRESYLEYAFGNPRHECTAEEEIELPPEFRSPEPEPELIPLNVDDGDVDTIRAHALGVKL